MKQTETVGIMRLMAWERAKGELMAILATYGDDDDGFWQMEKAIEKFVKDVDDNQLVL